jgi:hypothetical protein
MTEERKSDRSLNTMREQEVNDLLEDDDIQQEVVQTVRTTTRRVRLKDLISKMRSKGDMYELMKSHRKIAPLLSNIK